MVLGSLSRVGIALAAVLVLASAPAAAQKPKHATGKSEKDPATVTLGVALTATKDVLITQGYEVVSVETLSDRQIVTYRAGNQGKGRGKGPPLRMVIRRVENRIVLDDAPDALKLEIGIKLGIKL